MTHDTVGGNKR